MKAVKTDGGTQFRFKRTLGVCSVRPGAVRAVIRVANRDRPAGTELIFARRERRNQRAPSRVFASSGFLTSQIPSAVNP